jgi:hypothetical protein
MKTNRSRVNRHSSLRRRRWLHLEALEPRLAPANVDVLSFHNDAFLSGENLQEETLTPANVTAASFGRLVSQPVDDPVYAQPLYKANLMIGGTPHNVAFVATERDSVYAFDLIDDPINGLRVQQLWKTSFIDPANGITPIGASELGNPDIVPEIGITGTPVIDPATNTLYVVPRTREVRGGVVHYVEKLEALDITTGAEKLGGPYTIGDTTLGGPDGGFTNTTSIVVPGRGDGSDAAGNVRFNAARQMQRPALALLGGVVYVAWASQSDNRPYHGWVVGFSASTLQPVRWFNTAPNAGGAGIWESGGGLSVDLQGNIYFAEGNGFNGPDPAFDPPHNNYSESVLKLTPSGSQLNVNDYFTPYDWQDLDRQDADLGSGGSMLLPDFVGSATHQHLMVELGKSGKLYLIDRDNMGKFTAGGPDKVVQTVTAGQKGVWGNAAFFKVNATTGLIYYHGTDDVLKGYYITNGHIDDTPADILKSGFTSQFPGTQPVVSANGIANPTSPTDAITWELQVDAHGTGQQPTSPAILRAFGATNLATELYDSGQTGLRDQPDTGNKFTSLAVTNGRVMIGTSASFDVYGLFPAATAAPAPRTSLAGTLQSGTKGPQIQLTWTNPTSTAGTAPTGIQILRSLDGANFSLYSTVDRNAVAFVDPGPFTVGQRYYYQVVATNQQGNSAASNTVDVFVSIAAPILTVTGAGAVSVELSWTAVANDHYDVERSTDGVTFTTVVSVPAYQTAYTDTGLTAGLYAYRIHAYEVNPAGEALSNVQGASVGAVIDHSVSFANPADVTANGDAVFAETTARLTRTNNQTGSTFSNTRVSLAKFTTSFEVRIHEGTQPYYADGIAFVLQANAPTALGQGTSGLGYQGIGHSVAVKLSTFQHAGDPSSSSTGLVLNGADPAGGIDTTPSGVLLDSQDQKKVELMYDGTTLTEKITDIPRNLTFTTSYTVNLAQVIGSDTAYVGFTGATGSSGSWQIQDIVNWTFTSQAPLPGAPANPRVASATASEIDLAWDANSYNETGFRVERSTDGTNFSEIGTTSGTTYQDVGLASRTYFYRVRAYNVAGMSPYSGVLQTGVPGPVLVQHRDVGTPGDPALPGGASFANGVYTVTGSGHDIWDTADGFQFLYKPLIGDGTIQARVLSVGFTDNWAKAGVMIRESLAAGSRDAYVAMSPHNQVQFLYRQAAGAPAAGDGPTGVPLPIWVRVRRQGNAFTGFWSADGNTWNQINSPVTITMGPAVYVGLFASAHTNAALSTSTYDHVSILPAVLQTSHLDVSAVPTAINPGQAVTVTVKALDPFNNLVTGYTGTVHFTSSDPQAMLPADYTFTAADHGVHSFTVLLGTLGRQTVFATDMAAGAIDAGTAVTVTSEPLASALAIAGFPSPFGVGGTGTFTVTAKDSDGNTFTGYRGTVYFTSSDPKAQLPADYTFTAADNGVHTFSATLNTLGTQSITVTDTIQQLTATQAGIQVISPPSVATVVRSVATINEGGQVTVSGSVTDPVMGQTHMVIISWGDGTADTTLNLAVGVSTFSTHHAYAEEGDDQIQVTVQSADTGTDTVVLPVNVNAVPPPSGLVGWWSGDGTNSTTAPDLAGSNPGTLANGATHAPGEVGNAFSLNGVSQWVAVPTRTNIPIGNSPYTLLAWIKPNAAGTEGIIGYGNYGVTNQTNAFRLLDDGSGHLNFRHYWWSNDLDAYTALPANGTWHLAVAEFNGTTRNIVLDGQVIATDHPTGHNVPNAANFRIGSTNNGEFFNGLIDEAQVYNRALSLAEIQAIYNAGAAGLIKGVRVADPPVLATGRFMINAVAGADTGMQTVATFTDPGGAEAPENYTAMIDWGDNSSSVGTITGPVGGVFTVTGSHTYFTAGDATITVTLTHEMAPTATATSSAIVSPAAVSTLVVAGFPSPVVAGTAGTVTVTAQDAYGNTVTSYTGTVTFSSSDPQAQLPSDYTFTPDDNGTHTFPAILVTAGLQSITATDTTDDSITGTQTDIEVDPAPASSLVVAGFPSPVNAGTVGVFSVTAYDAYGNIATGYTGTVTFSSSDPAAQLPDDYAFTPDDNGIYYFAATLNTPGIQSITATDTADPSITGTQDGIEVDEPPMPATPVVFTPNFAGAVNSPSMTAFSDSASDPKPLAAAAEASIGSPLVQVRRGSHNGMRASAQAHDLAFSDWTGNLADDRLRTDWME